MISGRLTGTSSMNRTLLFATVASILAAFVIITFLFVRANATSPVQVAELHLLEPFWSSSTVYRESVLFIQDTKDSPAAGNLLFNIDSVISAHTADSTLTFQCGLDFDIGKDGRSLVLLPGSRIPFRKSSDLFPPKGAPNAIAHKTGDPNTHLFFGNRDFFHRQQVEVTYKRKPSQWKDYIPSIAEKELGNTLIKLRTGVPLTICVSGDSISEGYNSSSVVKAPPYMPPYAELVASQLEEIYDSKITLHNLAVAGWKSVNGLKAIHKLLRHNPDLVIVGYGMNDAADRDPHVYAKNISEILYAINTANPHTDVILVSSMLGHPDWQFTPPAMFTRFQDILRSHIGKGVALADMTALWQDLLKRKRYLDMSGNGINHPNDFGQRLYAQVILGLLVDPEQINTLQATKDPTADSVTKEHL